MAYDVRMAKLIDGEIVIGKWDEEAGKVKDPAVLQPVPTAQGVQMLLMPFGYPFEMEISGEIDLSCVMYQFKNFPEELKTKYLEATSNLTLATGGNLRNLKLSPSGAMPGNISKLLKK